MIPLAFGRGWNRAVKKQLITNSLPIWWNNIGRGQWSGIQSADPVVREPSTIRHGNKLTCCEPTEYADAFESANQEPKKASLVSLCLPQLHQLVPRILFNYKSGRVYVPVTCCVLTPGLSGPCFRLFSLLRIVEWEEYGNECNYRCENGVTPVRETRQSLTILDHSSLRAAAGDVHSDP